MRERDSVKYDIIHLKGLEFYGYHGLLPEEKTLGQRFVIDIDLYTSFKHVQSSGDIRDTINYAEVYELVKSEIETSRYDLIENLAESITKKIFDSFSCSALRLILHKPNAPIRGIFADVSVEIFREREK